MQDRRKFLTVVGAGGLGLVVAVPAFRLFASPTGEITVKTPTDPIDVGSIDAFAIGVPTKVTIVAAEVSDAWNAARDVVLGSAWVRRVDGKTIEVFSAVCPHLGCAVELENSQFICHCHDSAFEITGAKKGSGPSKRGLDALEHAVVDGRLRITWQRFAPDTSEKIPS